MSDWGKAKKAVGKPEADMEKEVKDYSYSNQKDTARTDSAIRGMLKGELEKCENVLMGIIELAYKEEEDEISRSLEEVRGEIEEFTEHIEIIVAPRRMPGAKQLEQVARADAILVRSARDLTLKASQLKTEVLGSRASDVVRKSQAMKDFLREMEEVYDERENALV